MSPKKRSKINAGLPKRWRSNSLYYMVPPEQEDKWDGKKEFKLGRSLPEAYKKWSDRIEIPEGSISTFKHLAERYLIEHVPTLSRRAQQSYQISTKRILAVFENTHVSDFTAQHARIYYDTLKSAKSVATAKSDVTVLRHMMSCALNWGVIAAHPMLGMQFENARPITDYES